MYYIDLYKDANKEDLNKFKYFMEDLFVRFGEVTLADISIYCRDNEEFGIPVFDKDDQWHVWGWKSLNGWVVQEAPETFGSILVLPDPVFIGKDYKLKHGLETSGRLIITYDTPYPRHKSHIPLDGSVLMVAEQCGNNVKVLNSIKGPDAEKLIQYLLGSNMTLMENDYLIRILGGNNNESNNN